MSAPRDLDRLLQSFLKEGPQELPDPSYDEVRDRIEHARQRAFIRAWRTPDVNRYLSIGLAAAAVVLIAVVGFNLLPGSPAPGGEPSATPEPSAAEPSSATGGLPEGPHVLTEFPVAMAVTIPAPGWDGEVGGGILIKNADPESPDGAGMIVFPNVDEMYVYADPCHWSTTRAETPATTVDEAVAALASQASRDASAPVDITLDGYTGKAITLHVPDDANFVACDQGYFAMFQEDLAVGPDAISRYAQGPGQIDEVWILDVDGQMVVIDWAYFAETPQADVDELRAIVESTTFGGP
jgi:hypothetical protein